MTFKYMTRTVGRPRDARRIIITRKGYGPNWAAAKKACLERDHYTCQKCGHIGRRLKNNRWNVDVHHKRKIAWFVNSTTGEVDYEAANNLVNLITLCRICHKVADGHARRKGFVPLA